MERTNAPEDCNAHREAMYGLADADSPEDRATYCRYLQRDLSDAYQVLEAGSAAVGLDLYQHLIPDAVLLEYSLPDMDGLECLGKRSEMKYQHYPEM